MVRLAHGQSHFILHAGTRTRTRAIAAGARGAHRETRRQSHMAETATVRTRNEGTASAARESVRCEISNAPLARYRTPAVLPSFKSSRRRARFSGSWYRVRVIAVALTIIDQNMNKWARQFCVTNWDIVRRRRKMILRDKLHAQCKIS